MSVIASTTPESAAPPPPDGAALQADVCRRCGYALIGLSDRTACPECGLLVGFSRTQSDELRHAKRGWLFGDR